MSLKVRNRSTEVNGDRYVGGYYVAEAITAGIPKGTLVYVDGNGVVQKADHKTSKGAMGIIYSDDVRDARLAYSDNPEGNAMPKSKGGKSIEMEKKAIVDIVSPNAKTYFRMADETLTGTVTTASTTAMTGAGTAFLTELKVGDYIVVAGETVRQVATIADDTNATVSVAFTNAAAGLAVTGKSMKNKPVFLGEAGATTKFGALNATMENLTVLVSITGEVYQEVGFIDGSKILHIDLTKQLDVATKA
jgi:hypothetical protein